MRRLYLHIGSNKTGTTTLQRRLSRSGDALAGVSWLYPGTGQSPVGAHHRLAGHISTHVPKAFRPRETFPELLAELSAELDKGSKSGLDKVILSSELLFRLDRNRTEALRELFQLFDEVRVIVYLRRQDRFLISFFNSQVRTGMSPKSFPEFCRNQRPRYLRNLEAWEGLVGRENLLVRPFVRRCWPQGEFIRDFLHQVGCPLQPDELAVAPDMNQSLSLDAVDVIRAVGARRNVERWDGFVSFVEEQLRADTAARRGTLMTGELYHWIRRRYASENAEIGERYLQAGEQDVLGFDDNYVPPGPIHRPDNPEARAELLVARWRQKLASEAREAAAGGVRNEPPRRWFSRWIKQNRAFK